MRSEFRQARLEFARKSGPEIRSKIESNMLRLIEDLCDGSSRVGLYRPRAEEASFELEPVEDYFYPRIVEEDIEFLRPRDGNFVRGRFGIEEPSPSRSETLPSGRHLIFTPAVAVDAQGGRLGMGRGFYDRYFARHPEVLRVGVVFQVQVSKHPLPRDEWDQPLDWIVTENMILETSQRSS